MLGLVDKLKALRGDADPGFKITFTVPQPLAQEPLPDFANLQQAIKQLAAGSQRKWLDQCRREARKLSRCSASNGKRVAISEDFVARFMPVVVALRTTFSMDGGIPDSERRQELLDSTVETLRLIIESYKIAFKALYASAGGLRIGAASDLELAAFRILELVKIQQQVMGLRYEVLPSPVWQVVNTVFHGMLARNQIDAKIPTAEARGGALEAPEKQSIRDMFLAVHLMAKFDILRWPTDWQAFLRTYCKSVDWLAEIAIDNGAELARGMAVAYAYDQQPTRLARPADAGSLGPGAIINWNKLYNKVTQDFLAFFTPDHKGELSDFQKKLSTLPFNISLSIVQLQFQSVTNERPQAAIETGTGIACDLRIFTGFKAIYQLLQNIKIGKFGVGNRLEDVLAKRSAALAEDNLANDRSTWFLLHQDERVLQMKTEETQFTKSMTIGMMVAYGFGDEGNMKPRCGVISRIYRPAPRTVIVEILKQGDYVDPAVVSTDPTAFDREERKAGFLLGAIVVREPTGAQSLLLPPASTLHANTELAMMRGSQRHKATLQKLRLVTRDFFVFQVVIAD